MLKRMLISCVLAMAFLVPATPASAYYRYRVAPYGYYGRGYSYGPRYYARPYVARPYYAPYYGAPYANPYYGGYYQAPFYY